MHEGRITEMEMLTIREQLMAEELCARKVQMYMNQTRDPAIQGLLREMAEKGQRHISTLNNMLHQETTPGGYMPRQ